jgi:DNA-binding MarR family transcriptional regulator
VVAELDAERLEAALIELARQPSMSAFSDLGPTLERSAYFILGKLHRSGPMSIGQLAEAFWLDQSTINRQTAALLRSGLVARIPDPDGGLARKFVLTDDGRRRYLQERDRRIDGLRDVLADWRDTDLRRFTELLERFAESVDAFRRRRHGADGDA